MSSQTAAKPAAKPAAAPKAKTHKQGVPESLLKKRATQKKIRSTRTATHKTAKKQRATVRKVIFKRAEKYVKEYRNTERALVAARRQAKASGNIYREPEAKVAFVVRIRGINGLHPKPRKILQLLRLRQINNGVFVRLTNATLNMLKRVEPYVAYGYPNLKAVKELVYKRGFAKVDKQRLPITDNRTIEKALGKYGILCVEDVIHEIVTCGKHFREVNKFLWPFKLPNPRFGWRTKNTHFNEGGDGGNRVTLIEHLLARHDVARDVPEIDRDPLRADILEFVVREILPGHDRLDARKRRRFRRIDRADAGMRVRRAQDAADDRAGHRIVGGVHRLAGDLRHAVRTDRTGSDNFQIG